MRTFLLNTIKAMSDSGADLRKTKDFIRATACWLMRWLNLKNSTSVHNTQGIRTKEAVEQGLRGNNRPEKGIGNRWNYDGFIKELAK